MSAATPLVETTEDRLRRELSQSSQAEARESLLREECARLRADNRALKRAEARRLDPREAPMTSDEGRLRRVVAPNRPALFSLIPSLSLSVQTGSFGVCVVGSTHVRKI